MTMTTTNGGEATAAPSKDDYGEAPKRSESDVYDRQIRLWGAEAQAKMGKASVLYIHLTGVSSEVLKNLVLAGIKPVLCDNRPYHEAICDTPSFFVTPEKEGRSGEDGDGTAGEPSSSSSAAADEPPAPPKKKKTKFTTVAEAIGPLVEELNPLLGSCDIVSKSVADLDGDFVSQFSIVIASRISPQDAIRLSKATVAKGGKFYMVDSFGMHAAAAFDLGKDHAYRPEKGKELLDATTLADKHVPLETMLTGVALSDATNRFHKSPPPTWILYRCLLEYADVTQSWPSEGKAQDFAEKVRAWIEKTSPSLLDHELLSDKALQDLAMQSTSEIAPVCSVLAGKIGDEVIKAISGKGEPANNTFLFDGFTCKLWHFLVKPKEVN